MTKDVSQKIERLLANESRGLLIVEIAQRVGVHRHTARKYVECMAAEGRIVRRKVGRATICYRPSRRMRGGLWFCIMVLALAFASQANAVSDCTGTDTSPCQECSVYAINITLYYPNGSLAAYTLNATPSSSGSCTCACYTADCCATDTYKNYSAAWAVGYTVCPVEGAYTAKMDTNATQMATEWEGISSAYTTYNVDWDADQNWCQCRAGAGRWSIGGEVHGTTCCGDDSGENKLARVCDGIGCSSDPTDDACCSAATDCVWISTCYADAASHPSLGGVDCSSGTWTLQNPEWRNQQMNANVIAPGGTITLAAQGKSAAGLGYAWVETNESGTWRNHTDGSHGSPMDMASAADWTWSNFTWSNASVPTARNVAWKIWYNDTSGNTNGTGAMIFLVDNVPYASSSVIPAEPVDTDGLNLYGTCSDADGGTLTAYWRWWKNGAIHAGCAGSASATNGTQMLLHTLGSINTSEGEQWTGEVWCSDGLANSTSSNATVTIAQGPDHSIQVKLTIDGVGNHVYVPGRGELNAAGADVATSSPGDYYLASYGGDVLYGLIFFYKTAQSLAVTSTGANHTLVINASMANSNIFLAFTRGSWVDISKMMPLIEAGTFLMRPLPSFGYGLATKSVVSIVLKYADIDISGAFNTGKGSHSLVLTNQNGAGKALYIQIQR